ncbi:MAG TPA: PCRF domain-containing protein, partial [Candidatus Saccharibacteria bacterium]|nr:PCRF domain-containing protein [Candidatus Saccharibacteria bacterium]
MTKIAIDIPTLTQEKNELEAFLADPSAYSDPDFSKKNKRFIELQTLIEKAVQRDTLETQLAEARELASGSDELAELAKVEVEETEAKLETLNDELFTLLSPKDPND